MNSNKFPRHPSSTQYSSAQSPSFQNNNFNDDDFFQNDQFNNSNNNNNNNNNPSSTFQQRGTTPSPIMMNVRPPSTSFQASNAQQPFNPTNYNNNMMMMDQQQQQSSSSSFSWVTSWFKSASNNMNNNTSSNSSSNNNNAYQSYEPVVDEVPLLEELGINFRDVWTKSVFVLNPLSKMRRYASQKYRITSSSQQQTTTTTSSSSSSYNNSSGSSGRNSDDEKLHHILNDMDLTGPLLFCLALGFVLLLRGKIHFGYIYGVGTIGCLAMYFLLNLMCPPQKHIEIQHTVSVLGYGLLPMVFLAIISALLPLWLDVRVMGTVGSVISLLVVIWSTWSAASMFVGHLSMHNQKALVAYPVLLVYVTFAFLTVF